MRVTDPPTAMIMEDEGEGKMGADSTEISHPATMSENIDLLPGTYALHI